MRSAAAPVRPARGGPRHGGGKPRRSWPGSGRRSRRCSMAADDTTTLRRLPSVDQLVRSLADRPELSGISRARLTAAVREAVDEARRRALAGSGDDGEPAERVATQVIERLRGAGVFSLRPVVNATGVVLHTNL